MSDFSVKVEKLLEADLATIDQRQKSITQLFPKFYQRVKAVASKGGVRLIGSDDKGWKFKVHSGTKDSTWYDVNVWFEGVPQALNAVFKDRGELDLASMAIQIMRTCGIKISCACPAALYWGSDYILSQDDLKAKIPPEELRPPDIRNPNKHGAMCFDDHAKVLCSGGIYKSIRDVKVGDMVVTHLGRLRRVQEVFVREVDSVFELENTFWPEKYGVTGEHPFLVSGDKHDDLIEDMVWVEAKNLKQHSHLFMPKIQVLAADTITFDPDIARLLGYFVAEGSYTAKANGGWDSIEDAHAFARNGARGQTGKQILNSFYIKNKNSKYNACSAAVFTININEDETVGADIVNICRTKFGVEPYKNYCGRNGNKTWVQIVVNSKDVARMCYEYVGRYSESKVVHSDIFRWQEEARLNFLAGYFMGDSCLHLTMRGGDVVAYSVNMSLLEQMSVLLASVGIRSRVADRTPFKPGYASVKKLHVCKTDFGPLKLIWEQYKGLVVFRDIDFIRKNTLKDGFIYRLVSKNPVQGKRYVYNLSVEEDESYIVCGTAVHNCKHEQMFFNTLSLYGFTFVKWLRKYYGDVILAIENKGRKLAAVNKEFAKGKKVVPVQGGSKQKEEPRFKVKKGVTGNIIMPNGEKR
jgi:hypothetical protein